MKKSINVSRKLRIGRKILYAKLFKKYIPLAVSWAITRRCNLTCHYCGIPSAKQVELGTAEIFSLIDKLASLGTERISFTGGEPLLRDDLGRIIDHAKKRGIFCAVNTNGAFISKAIYALSNVSRVTISLDGPKEVHNKLRLHNSYDDAIKAIEICAFNKVPLVLATVLSKHNLNQINFVLDIARQFSAKVIFQPSQLYILGENKVNSDAPNEEDYRSAIKTLMEGKISGDECIYNSLTGLRHLYQWPQPTKIACWASKLHCRIDSDGTIYPCGHTAPTIMEPTMKYSELDKNGIYNKIAIDCCNQCWCATMVEFNLIASFNINALWNANRKGM